VDYLFFPFFSIIFLQNLNFVLLYWYANKGITQGEIMSCYESESGTIKLSTKEFARLKREFIQTLKSNQELAFQNAIKLQTKMLSAAKGKRNVDWLSVYGNCQFESQGQFFNSTHTDLDENGTFYRVNFSNGKNKKPLKPKKKDYFEKINRKELWFDNGDFNIAFTDKSKSIYWNVDENNHARDHAHSHPVAKALFRLLRTVKWTRGTGGTICGNDEYNRDCDYEGGGANYVTKTFGNLK
jgi:hypothetical protein